MTQVWCIFSQPEAGDINCRKTELHRNICGWRKSVGCSEEDHPLISLILERQIMIFRSPQESCNYIYGNYNECSCPRHDDHSENLYLSAPNSQTKFVDFWGFINVTKVTDNNLHPCSSSATLCCAVSASFPVFPTCSFVFCLSPRYLNSGAVSKFKKHLWFLELVEWFEYFNALSTVFSVNKTVIDF